MKRKVAALFTAIIMAATILTGCSQPAATVIEAVELDPETLREADDKELQQADSADDSSPLPDSAQADISASAADTTEQTVAVEDNTAQTEAAVMSSTVPSTPEDLTTTVQTSTEAVTGTFHYAEAYRVLALVNEHRESLGLNALTWDEDMRQAAEIRAAEATLNWSHTRPNGESWYTVSDLVKGENLAKGYNSAEDVFEAWMNSQGHRENIELEQATTIYVAYFEISSGGYWAMELGY
ncbi:MAG: CAP domain-containing protein [Lachnospiraceae bacterium]|nr:CAP domain-containing protein [Lachnospiraceae bacterium]